MLEDDVGATCGRRHFAFASFLEAGVSVVLHLLLTPIRTVCFVFREKACARDAFSHARHLQGAWTYRMPFSLRGGLRTPAFVAPDSTSRWIGSAAMDRAGDIAIGYSASSSSTIFPAIRYTGRTPSDALGTMRTQTSLVEGTGSPEP